MVTGVGEGDLDGLDADFAARRGAFVLDLQISVRPGEVVALLGPNGAGKSTAVRTLAGLIRPDRGSIGLSGRLLDDPATHLPAHRRGIGVVFQDYLLFPHLSVLDNVAFGLRESGRPRSSARAAAADWLHRLDADDLARLRPGQLSGGQAQRVALARALAIEPALLLLDEPLAALDARTRLRVRSELRRRLAEFAGPAVVISHDPTDAMVLADRLVVIESGTVVQEGTPQQVARRPQTDYVARLVGLNLLAGTGVDHGVRLDDGTMINTADRATGRVQIAFRPSAVALWRDRPAGSPRNVWPVRVRGLEAYGDLVRVELSREPEGSRRQPATHPGVMLVAEVTHAAVAELELDPGRAVWATVKASEIDVY